LRGRVGGFDFLKKGAEFGQGKRVELGHGFPGDPPVSGFGAVSLAGAGGASAIGSITSQKDADMHLVGFGFKPSKKPANAIPVSRFPKFGEFPSRTLISLKDELLLVGRKILERDFEWNFFSSAGFFEIALAFFKTGGLPRFDGTSCQGEVAVGKGEGLVDFDDSAKPSAGGAGAEGMIKGKKCRRRFVKIPLVAGAVVAIGVEVKMVGIFDDGDGSNPLSVAKARSDRFDQASFVGGGKSEAILDDRNEEILFFWGLA
jgi:hypothetical protein